MQSGLGLERPLTSEDRAERVIADAQQLDDGQFLALVEHYLPAVSQRDMRAVAQHMGLVDEQGRPTEKSLAIPRTRGEARELAQRAAQTWQMLDSHGQLPSDVDADGQPLGSLTADHREREAAERSERQRKLYGDDAPADHAESFHEIHQKQERRARAHWQETREQRQREDFAAIQRRRIRW
jgi:hypothetical protein